MKYSARPDLRERMYRLYCSRNTKGEYSNIENIGKIAELRRRIAALLGAPDYASHSLRRTMAEKPEAVYDLLDTCVMPIVPLSMPRWPSLQLLHRKSKDIP